METQTLRVARLQNEVGTKDFLRHEFSHEKCSEIFPKFFEPYSAGQKNPAKFPPNFPPQNQKKAPTSFSRSARRTDPTQWANWGNFMPRGNFHPRGFPGAILTLALTLVWGLVLRANNCLKKSPRADPLRPLVSLLKVNQKWTCVSSTPYTSVPLPEKARESCDVSPHRTRVFHISYLRIYHGFQIWCISQNNTKNQKWT